MTILLRLLYAGFPNSEYWLLVRLFCYNYLRLNCSHPIFTEGSGWHWNYIHTLFFWPGRELQQYIHYVVLLVRGNLGYILLLDLGWSSALIFISKSVLIRCRANLHSFYCLVPVNDFTTVQVEYMAGYNAQAFEYNQTLWSISSLTCLLTSKKKRFLLWAMMNVTECFWCLRPRARAPIDHPPQQQLEYGLSTSPKTD